MSERQFYIVQKVLQRKRKQGKFWYLIKWENYNDQYNTWEPQQNLQEETIKHFENNTQQQNNKIKAQKIKNRCKTNQIFLKSKIKKHKDYDQQQLFQSKQKSKISRTNLIFKRDQQQSQQYEQMLSCSEKQSGNVEVSQQKQQIPFESFIVGNVKNEEYIRTEGQNCIEEENINQAQKYNDDSFCHYEEKRIKKIIKFYKSQVQYYQHLLKHDRLKKNHKIKKEKKEN